MHRRLTLMVALVALVALACQPAPAGSRAAAPAPAPPGQAAPAAPAAPAAQPAGQPTAPPPLLKITAAIVSPSEVFSVPWVGRDSGVFARHGLEVDVPLVTGSPRLTQSLIAGDFDYALVGVTAVMRARMQGADPLILAAAHNYSTQSVVVRPQAGIRAIQDVKGKTVGISQIGSEADAFLQIALGRAGLRPDDVQPLQTGGHPQTVAALVSGNLDVGVIGGANVLRAQQAGIVKLAGARDLNVLSPSGIVAATRRHIDRDRAAVMRFIRAYVDTVHYFKTERADTIRILQANLGDLAHDEVEFLYDDMRELIQPVPLPTDEAIQAILDGETEPQAKSFKPSDFVDPSFVRELEQSGYISALYK
jgi:NitT/TauT family transport system substrate-binding protein